MAEADQTSRYWIAAGAANGLMAVVMGAFAAHGLRGSALPQGLGWVKTASDYQMWHGLALLALAALARGRWTLLSRLAAIAFLVGIILFSGGLYLLALSGWTAFAWITPLGGISLLIGWALLLAFALAPQPGP
ncbi:MAG TPA: DUF423 domain-containing protein [Dongiaceae bacterium]|nr:DUF423 domain-containing protein [Dongiaceae bacterium]